MKRNEEALTLFEFDDAVPLAGTDMMSMPTMTEPAPEQLTEWATAPGHDVRVLYRHADEHGPSLVWSRFAPHYILPRHSHSADCLYFVISGEAHLGNRVVHAGGGFYVPADAPYAYQAGPDGIEILEFRNESSFDMKISESLPPGIASSTVCASTATSGRWPRKRATDMARFDELGFYTLAGAPASTRELVARGPRRRGDGPRSRVRLRAAQPQGGGDRLRRGRCHQRADRHRHRGDEPQHAPPDGDRGIRCHHAQPHRRALHVGSRTRRRPVVRRDGPVAHHHRAGRGLRRVDAPPVAGRDDPRPRRPRRIVAVPQPRRRRGVRHPARLGRVRPQLPRSRRTLLRPGRAAHLLHRRDHHPLRADREAGGRAAPVATPTT